jgi:hypothetical protein
MCLRLNLAQLIHQITQPRYLVNNAVTKFGGGQRGLRSGGFSARSSVSCNITKFCAICNVATRAYKAGAIGTFVYQ